MAKSEITMLPYPLDPLVLHGRQRNVRPSIVRSTEGLATAPRPCWRAAMVLARAEPGTRRYRKALQKVKRYLPVMIERPDGTSYRA